MSPEPVRPRVLARWLWTVCALIVLLVCVGGITRLTGSGLSIVEWKPVTGVLPPITDSAWTRAFEAYQQFPQYRLVNQGMSLAQFKVLFFWEYLHRLLGRLVGLLFALPVLCLTLRRLIDPRLMRRLWIGVALFGAQGLLGWFMVKSGLVDRPSVSQLRLAAHLSLALVLLAHLAWTARSLQTRHRMLRPVGPKPARTRGRGAGKGRVPLRRHALMVWTLLAVQIVYGALTAGLHAGSASHTFPDWNGRWIPPELLALSPGWTNAFANPSTVQFLHRLIGTTLALAVLALAVRASALPVTARVRRAVRGLVLGCAVQYALGVSTVMLLVPLSLAALHQLGAIVLWLLALELNHALLGQGTASAGANPDRAQAVPRGELAGLQGARQIANLSLVEPREL